MTYYIRSPDGDTIEAKDWTWFLTYIEHIATMAEKQGVDVLEISIKTRQND